MSGTASASFLLRFKGDFTQLEAGMKQISALAKSEAAKSAASSVGASPSQRVGALASDRGQLVGDIRSAQQAGQFTPKQADSMVQSVGRQFKKQFDAIVAGAGITPGTPLHKELQGQFKAVTADAATRRVKENQTAVAGVKEEKRKAAADKKLADATEEEAAATKKRTKSKDAAAKKAEADAAKTAAAGGDSEEKAKGKSGSSKAKKTVYDQVLGGGDKELSPEEQAIENAKARKTAVKYGAATQKAYLNQIQDDPEFAKQLAEERASQAKRLAIENQNYNSKVLEDFKTSKPGQSQIEQSAAATASGKQIAAFEKAGSDAILANQPKYAEALAISAISQQQVNAAMQAILAASTPYQQALINAAVTEREATAARKAAIEAMLAQSVGYNKSIANTKISQAQQRLSQSEEFIAAGGIPIAGKEKAVAASVQAQINAVKMEELATDEAAIKAKAQTIVADRAYTAAVEKEVLELTGAQPRGRFLGFLGGKGRGGGGGGLTGEETAGEFFGGGLRSTIRHTVPALALFAIGAEIVKTVKQASELERIFNQIEDQFKAVDDAAAFPKFKQSVLDISRETGVASDVLANIAFQYKGAFAGPGNDNAYVLRQTKDAAKIAKVTGLDPNEVVDSLTAAGKSFNVDNKQIGAVALDIQDRYGVLAKETIKFLGDIAPAAQDAGFSLEEIATIAGIAQQRSGRSGAALAESFGRVLPAMREAKGEMLGLAASSDAFKTPEFLRAVMSGDVAKQFEYIAQHFSELDAQGQGFVVQLLGGRREAQSILPVFADGQQLDSEIAKTRAADPKLLENRFKKLQETLTQTTARLGETFKQLGVTLFESGLGDFLKDMAEVAKVFVSAFALVARVLLTVNKATGGMAGRLLAVYTVFKLMSALRTSKIATAAGGLFTPGAGLTSAIPAFQSSYLAARAAGGGIFGSLRAGAGATGVGIGAGSLALGAGAVGAVMYTQFRDSQQQQAAAYAAKLQDQSDAELQKTYDKELSKSKNGGLPGGVNRSDLGAFLSGAKTKTQLAQDEQQKRAAESYGYKRLDILKGGGLTNDKYKELYKNIDMNQFQKAKYSKLSFKELIEAYKLNPEDDALSNIVNDLSIQVLDAGKGKNGILKGGTYDQFVNAQVDAQRKKSKKDAVEKQLKNLDENYRSIDELQASYQSGEVNIGTLTSAVDKRIAGIQKALDISPHDEVALKEMAKYVKLRSELWGSFIDQQTEIDLKVAEFTGQMSEKNAPDVKIAALMKKLRNPKYDDPAKRKEAALGIAQEYKNKFDQKLNSDTTSASELQDLTTNGLAIPKDVQAEFIKAQIGDDNIQFTELFNTWRGMAGGKKSEIQDLIRKAASGTKQEREIIIADLKSRAERLKEFILVGAGSTAEIDRAIANYQIFMSSIAELTSGNDFGAKPLSKIFGDPEADKAATKKLEEAKLAATKAKLSGNNIGVAQAELDAANKELADAAPESIEYYKALERQQKAEQGLQSAFTALADAKSNYAKALNAGNPLALANIGISDALRKIAEAQKNGDQVGVQNGQAELVQAQRQRRDYYISLAEAQADYDLALVENDPVAAAQYAVSAAQRMMANAENDVDRLKAKAAEVRANRQLANIQQDIVNAQLELMQAWAEYAGDTVLSSELALQKAKENLTYLKKNGAGEAELKRAQAAVVQAQAQVRDSQLQDKLDTYNYLYEMDKISKGQLITYLQSLLKIPNLTEQQIRDINLQIKQLRDDLTSNFNVPDLTLPTAYEIARTDQLDGQTYQSARSTISPSGNSINNNQSYNIVINAHTTMEADKALKTVKEAIESSPRSGYDPRYF